jgi:hypothetical protein
VQTLADTQLASLVDGDPRRPTTFGSVQVVPTPSGGYVVGWASFSTSATVGTRNALFAQRFDDLNQPEGGVVNVGSTINLTSYRIVADAIGGYTVYWSGVREDFLPTGLMVTHYQANGGATQILTGWTGNALLLPLEDGRFVLYTSDANGVYSQFLNEAGAPIGQPAAAPAMPVFAQQLADGSYVVFWTARSGGMTAQRYDANGQPIGDMLTLQTSGTQRIVVALAEGGFAVTWATLGLNADLDVFTQQFLEAAGNSRKACLMSAKGLRGQERKAFMANCLR